jgi:apolipoprotein N-acyltransferase
LSGPRDIAAPGWRPLPVAADAAGAAALGALQTWAFVDTRLWWLPLLCVAALAWRVAQASPRRATLLGAAFGTAWLVAGVWWLFISMHRYGGLPAWLAAAAVLLLALALSTYLALALRLVARWRSGRPWSDATLFAAAWLAAELARGVLFTGFPWLASGYAQVDGPLAALAPWIGVYGLGALAAWWSAGLAATLAQPRASVRWRGLVLLALVLAWPAWTGPASFTRPSGVLRVALVQTNVAQDEKFAAERMPQALDWVAAAMFGADADLVVAPETAVPLLPAQLDELVPGYWEALTRHFGRADGPAALVGVPLGSYEAGYTNSVAGLSTESTRTGGFYRYDKQHLVPFGEFIPTGFRWFTTLMDIPLGDFNRGPRVPPSFAVRGERVAPNVCYEDLFGEELALRFATAAAAPTVLANVSNIGWFGDTIAVRQHLQISRFRSLELQRPMLRATNTGATVVIDHQGRVTAALPTFTRGVLLATVQGRDGLTPFARWASVAGLWPLAGLSAAGLLWAGWRQCRRGR